MNNTVINIKTNAEVKRQAQQVAGEMGFSLSSLINAYLKQLIRSKRVDFSLEEPSEYLIETLRQSEKDIKEGHVSPRFDSVEEGIAWLNKE